jgi:hypothetical protein
MLSHQARRVEAVDPHAGPLLPQIGPAAVATAALVFGDGTGSVAPAGC